MHDTGSSSHQRALKLTALERRRRARKIIILASAAACAAGAITASISQPPSKTMATGSAAPKAGEPSTAEGDPWVTGSTQKEPARPERKPKTRSTDDLLPVAKSQEIPAAQFGIPAMVLDAYRRAANEQASRTPECHLSWPLLAAIGQIESHHASGGALTPDGFTTSPILGPALNGDGFAALPDSDQGRLDADRTWDRAVGPMQFIPSTWKRWATTTRPGGEPHPGNIFDATTSAASYLCADNRNHDNPGQLADAILSYNHSQKYLDDVLAWKARYSAQAPDALIVPPSSGSPDDTGVGHTLPPLPGTDSKSVDGHPPRPPRPSETPSPQAGPTSPPKRQAPVAGTPVEPPARNQQFPSPPLNNASRPSLLTPKAPAASPPPTETAPAPPSAHHPSHHAPSHAATTPPSPLVHTGKTPPSAPKTDAPAAAPAPSTAPPRRALGLCGTLRSLTDPIASQAPLVKLTCP